MTSPSFEEFVAGRATRLLRTSYLLTGDRAQATDLLLTGLAAVRRAPLTDLDEGVDVARRAMVAEHTSWRRRLEVGHLLADSPLLAGMSALPGFTSPTQPQGARSATGAALARLPARTRTALVLRYGEGLGEADVAALLDSPVADVRTETEQGLAALDGLPAGEAGKDRLRRDLAEQAAEVTAAPAGLVDLAGERQRGDRRHVAGLLALLLFAVAVVLVVVLSLR